MGMSLQQDSNDYGIWVVNFAASKNLVVKSTMIPHQNIHKYTRTPPNGHTHNHIDQILIDSNGIRVFSMYDLAEQTNVILITIWWFQKLGKDWQ
jgi:hypothetical protein